jgi:chorismate--pyruvate lyase
VAEQRSIQREPTWQPERQYTASTLPPAMRYWLLDDGSLTNRLTVVGQGDFAVQRLAQSWQVPMPSEQRLLGLPLRQIALIREVALLVRGEPVVFARSVFPVSSLAGELAHLRKLQNRSLGSILFRHRGMHRSPFELAYIPGDSDYLPTHLHQREPAWGRRSRFAIAGKSLMVSEVFLKGFTPWPDVLPVHRSQRGTVEAANPPPKSVS